MYNSGITIRFTNKDTIELSIKETNEIIVYKYASFGERFLARLLDIFIVILPQVCIPIIPSWLYWSLSHSSNKQRTVGQAAAGIQILSIDGQQVTFGQATGRYFANFLNLFTFFIGYFMFFSSDKKQCLHDSLSGVVVVREFSRRSLISLE